MDGGPAVSLGISGSSVVTVTCSASGSVPVVNGLGCRAVSCVLPLSLPLVALVSERTA